MEKPEGMAMGTVTRVPTVRVQVDQAKSMVALTKSILTCRREEVVLTVMGHCLQAKRLDIELLGYRREHHRGHRQEEH